MSNDAKHQARLAKLDELIEQRNEAQQSLHELREAFQHLKLKHDEAYLRGSERAQALVALKSERDEAQAVITETRRLIRDEDVWAAIDYIQGRRNER